MKDRLAQFLKSEGLTAVKFAEIMEVQPSSISHLLAGRNRPNFEFISRMLLRFPELNPDWIINGLGEMYKTVKVDSNDLFTDVNEEEVTEVSPRKFEEKDSEITAVNTDERINNKRDGSDLESEKPEITNVTTQQLIPEREKTREMKKSVVKSIERIVLFYADGSFDEYHN